MDKTGKKEWLAIARRVHALLYINQDSTQNWGNSMTSRTTYGIFLMTAASCAVLAACGGESARYSATYEGDSTVDRTAGYNESANAAPHSLAARMNKLENDVAVIKNDVSQLAMTYNGLMTTNERIDALLTRLEGKPVITSVPVVEKAPATAPKPAVAPKPTSLLPSTPTIMGVRLGEHPDRTRLVIDSSTQLKPQTDLDNAERILLITLGKNSWDAKRVVSGLSSPLVAGWSVDEANGNQILAVQLKKPVKILATSALKPDGGKPARVVIDLAGQ